MTNSFTEENYLKIIYHLSQELEGAEVSTNALAEMSQTKAASVSDMLKKLSDKKLVNYQKYQGVTLTKLGQNIALKVIRRHRLWEVFLVEKLNFTWDEVHFIAEELEHINSDKLVDKLDEFLGYPKFDPHGDPIPDHSGKFPDTRYHTLSDIKVGEGGLLLGVSEHSPSFLKYLDKIGLVLGCHVHVAELNEYDNSMTVKINQEIIHFLSHEVAKNLLIKLNK
jgi:DtxR family transcriptional regulator, Mn-dependent transcriptional regulator